MHLQGRNCPSLTGQKFRWHSSRVYCSPRCIRSEFIGTPLSYRRLTRARITVSFLSEVRITVHRSRIVPLLVIFSLLVTSIVYACSGLERTQMTSMSATMDHSAMEGKPCNNHTQDICKSLRYQMLSLRPSLVVSEITLYLSTNLYSAQYDVPLLTSLVRGAGPPGIIFPSASEVSFPFSSQVLRI